MNTFEIINALKNEPNFVGCFARDRLPAKTGRPAGLVINTDKSTEGGTHWVAYYISKEGGAEYFDPLGSNVPANEILAFIKRNGGEGWTRTVRNNIGYQSNDSWKCGQFCVFYLKKRLNGRSVCEIHASLSQNASVNDSVV